MPTRRTVKAVRLTRVAYTRDDVLDIAIHRNRMGRPKMRCASCCACPRASMHPIAGASKRSASRAAMWFWSITDAGFAAKHSAASISLRSNRPAAATGRCRKAPSSPRRSPRRSRTRRWRMRNPSRARRRRRARSTRIRAWPLPLVAIGAASVATASSEIWSARSDLLGSDGDAYQLVVETDDDGRGHLRFGDGRCGRAPTPGACFCADYRVGVAAAGNVAARSDRLRGVPRQRDRRCRPAMRATRCRRAAASRPNRSPPRGSPRRARSARRSSARSPRRTTPNSRKQNTALQRAHAHLAWTGSWYEADVAVDPFGTEEAAPELVERIARRLECARRAGHDLAVQPARYVPLSIRLHVCVKPDYLGRTGRGGRARRTRQRSARRRHAGVLPSGQAEFRHGRLCVRPDRCGAGDRRRAERRGNRTAPARPAGRAPGRRRMRWTWPCGKSRASTTIRASPSTAC